MDHTSSEGKGVCVCVGGGVCSPELSRDVTLVMRVQTRDVWTPRVDLHTLESSHNNVTLRE